jgi:uncharacterized protein
MSIDIESLVARPLVDHHCHGVVEHDLPRSDFELLMSESEHAAPAGTSHFDTPLGISIRQLCAPVLDLEPGVPAERYLQRRAELGAAEVNRRLLRESGIGTLLIETGYRSDDILSPGDMAVRADAVAYEVVRIEQIAERVAERGVDASEYAHLFEQELRAASTRAVGLKTIVGYRGGFRLDPEPPSSAEVRTAAQNWFGHEGPTRLHDPVLLRFGLVTGFEVARDLGLPVQFHVGYGDADISMSDNDPSLLNGWLKRAAGSGVDVTLLHCYPFHRQAGWLAAIHPNTYMDVGLTLNYLGPAAERIFAEACELTPFTKHLFSSDAFGLAELYYLGARRYRTSLAALLEDWLTRGECGEDDAARIAACLGGDNARRIYPLERARVH